MITFTATIYKIGINPVVDPPDDVLDSIFIQAGRSKRPIPVCGSLNGADYIQTLVKYAGAWRMYINAEMLNASGLGVGDLANVEIEFDPRPRDVPAPTQLEKALTENKEAHERFDRLTPSRRKEILQYLGSLKTEESLQRNVEKVVRQLAGETRISAGIYETEEGEIGGFAGAFLRLAAR